MKEYEIAIKDELRIAVEHLSRQQRLLVVTDFDGTISYFTDHYEEATLDPQAKIALRILSELPQTEVAVISGRSLTDLNRRFAALEGVRLIGSHGHEFDIDEIAILSEEQKAALLTAAQLFQGASSHVSGSRVEYKPHGVVFHYRGLETPPPREMLEALTRKLLRLGVGLIREGSMVLEYCIVMTNKGDALNRIQELIGPTATLFIGDDVTDEAAFQRLGANDVSIKVGDGETAARYRVRSPHEVVQFLILLSQLRTEWIHTMPTATINKHFFLSDLRTCALVDPEGSISWLCMPRIDGAPLFGSLVGGAGSGYFRVAIGENCQQTYLENTMVVQTSHEHITLTDFFDCGEGRTFQRSGRSDLVRLIKGTGKFSATFAPKFDFGRVPTQIIPIDSGLRVECGHHRAVLLSPGCTWHINKESGHDVAFFERSINDEELALILMLGTSSGNLPLRSHSQMFDDTMRFWRLWINALTLPKQHASLVARSALVLRSLSYGPTGAIAAAATTSLPEILGGVRNWDYRYCWPRDAALAASALIRLNGTGPGIRLLDWLMEVVIDRQDESFLAPLYTVTGKSVPSEAEVAVASGYKGSRPVRIGNLAAAQLQLDTLAPVAELMRNLSDKGVSLTIEHLHLCELLVSYTASRWRDPDSGIWEVRSNQRQYVHSKLMCWYTVYNCILVAEGLGVIRQDWIDLLAEIRVDIETYGYDPELQSYVAAYDLKEADSALLWVVLSGFHPPSDPRCIGTVEYICSQLVQNETVYRYRYNDALVGQEGEFIICRCWLIEALARMGRIDEARRYLNVLIGRIGASHLLSEEWDDKHGISLGNYPQAYSHLGLINAVCALEP